MHEMDLDAVDRRLELVELVQPPLLGAPVVLVAPVGDKLTEVGQVGAVVPVGAAELVRKPRASQALMLAVRARALLDGRFAPSVDDVLELAEPVLKHRMALSFAARAEGETIPNVIRRLKARIG